MLFHLVPQIYSTPVINSEIKEKLINILNEDNNGNGKDISLNKFCTYEDLIMMLNTQCYLNEIQLNQNDL